MLIDWFTVLAQIINFLILVALLKRFLYGPIIKIMSERERKIASQLEQAARREREAGKEVEAYRQKNEELEQARQKMLEQAQVEADAWQQDRLAEARAEIEAVQRRWRRSIEQEQGALLAELRTRIADQALSISRIALADVAGADLEERTAEIFIERIQNLDPEALEMLKNAVGKSGRLIAAVGHELAPDTQARIKTALSRQIGEIDELRFELSPELITGIELKASDYKLSWTLKGYLETLADGVSELFQERRAEREWN